MARTKFESLEVYRLSERLSDTIWHIVRRWSPLDQSTVGRQMIRAADSVGANIAEGIGRGSFQDNRRFVRMARGSLYEAKHWLRRAYRRKLLTSEQVENLKPLMDELAPRLNAYLRSIGEGANRNGKAALDAPGNDNEQRTTDNRLIQN